MTTVRREVAENYPNDEGRSFARLDPNTLLELELETGDHVQVSGQNDALAKVWRADREDWEDGKIFIDRFTRYNAQVESGDTVTIEKITLDPIDRITLLPYRNANVEFGEEAVEMLHKQLMRTAVQVGNIVPIQLTGDKGTLPLVVTGSDTESPGILKESTKIHIPDGYQPA